MHEDRDRAKRSRMDLVHDEQAIEGFMSEIPALTIIVIAITAFMIISVSATNMYLADKGRVEATEKAKDIGAAIRSYDPIIIDHAPNHLSADALDDLVNGTIELDLKNSGDMRVTVWLFDQGSSNDGATMSWTFGNTDRTDPTVATMSHTVLVSRRIGPDGPIYSLGSMVVRTW